MRGTLVVGGGIPFPYFPFRRLFRARLLVQDANFVMLGANGLSVQKSKLHKKEAYY